MAYITKEYYDNLFNDGIELAEFTILESVASAIVNRHTVGKIDAFGFNTLRADLQDKIRIATAHQVNIMFTNGSLQTITGNSDLTSSSISIGDYSESFGGNGNFSGSRVSLVDGIPQSPMIKIILFGTNLLRTGSKQYTSEEFRDG